MRILTVLATAAMVCGSMPTHAGISGDYYEERAANYCASSSSCPVEFPAFPASIAGKFVVINEVSCFGTTSKSVLQGLLQTLGGNRNRGLNVSTAIPYFSFTNQVNYKVSATGNGLRVVLVATANTTFALECSIVGKITPN